MDGTLIDSTAGVVGAWGAVAEKYPQVAEHVPEILNSGQMIPNISNLANKSMIKRLMG
jgi:beta-phosphoglucomutase-like phosphatase (HAD superfamily)